MESKTIRVKRRDLCVKSSYGKECCWYRTADSRIAVVFPFQEFDQDRELEVTISIVASPEERLREAREHELRDLRKFYLGEESDADIVRRVVAIIERVDAEFAKTTPRE